MNTHGISKRPVLKENGEWEVICYCGELMVLALQDSKDAKPANCKLRDCKSCKYYDDLGEIPFWVCTSDGCDLMHSAEKNTGKPMGIPSSEECSLLRHYFHAEFDSLWESGSMKRNQAYCLLSRLLKIKMINTHGAMFDSTLCILAINAIRYHKRKNNMQLVIPKRLAKTLSITRPPEYKGKKKILVVI